MKTLKHVLPVVAIAFFTGCKTDEVENAPQSLFGFESNEPYIFMESDPDFFIPVTLDKSQFSYTAADLQIDHVTSSTDLYSDYYLDKRVMIYGGDVIDYIGTQIYNDAEADGNDTINVTLTNLDGNAYLNQNVGKRTAQMIILDDDNVPANQMNLHAYWTGATEISRNFRKDFDLDVYLMTDVVEGPDGIESGNYYKTSQKLNEFEDITLLSTAPDKEYYILVAYISNSFNDAAAKVTGAFKLSGFGYDDANSNLFTFEFDEPGYYYYWGPFKKTGKTFTRLN
jgi:hypothetical protein